MEMDDASQEMTGMDQQPLTQPTPQQAPQPAPQPTAPTKPPRAMGSNKLIFAGIGVIIIIAIVGGFLLLGSHPSTPASTTSSSNQGSTNAVSQTTSTSNTSVTSGSGTSQTSYSGQTAGTVTCTTSNPQDTCNAAYNPIAHALFSFNGNNITIVNGTFVSLIIGQSTGTKWTTVNATFVPTGAAFTNGIPDVNFTSKNQSVSVFDIYNGSWSLAINLPISKQYAGNFTGEVWLQYYLNGSSAVQYTKMGNLSVHTNPAPPHSIERSTTKGSCTSTYGYYTCSNPQLLLYKNYSVQAAFGNLNFSLTESSPINNTYISMTDYQDGTPFCINAGLPSMKVGHATTLNISAPSTCAISYGFYNITNRTPITLYLFAYNNTNRTYESNHNINITVYPTIIVQGG